MLVSPSHQPSAGILCGPRALSNLTSVSEAMLKCAELVVELESELDETTADEADHEELLKDAVRRSDE